MSHARHFSRFLAADPGRLHLAAHSHHGWPDVTEAGQRQAWLDAITLADRKWDKVFGEVVPAFQVHVARRLALSDPATIAVAPNTFDFVRRLLSCLPPRPGENRPARILTTDAEFHSFARQTARLEEDGRLKVTRIAAEPFDSFPARFAEAAGQGGHDLVFVSQVFFDSGYVVEDLAGLVGAVRGEETLVVVDGYHGFMALPTDLSAIGNRAFYLAGGYKYAMSGEGACFMHCPPGYAPRPPDTGWYAAFGALAGDAGSVAYAPDGGRFLGATFDPSGLYRFNAVMDWLDGLDLQVDAIDAHVRSVMTVFLAALERRPVAGLDPAALLRRPGVDATGHFLTFRTPQAGSLQERMMAANVVADHRRDRLRLGFALYHEPADADAYLARIAAALDD
ncbi:aminotransferase class V-fold PLP-dependent enzyme [Microbaculum marinum]|uniref:Aminotransferase class V-fold PLP-dependent enzyme n=1 Tax=Microbaculum marinum TaxID=1764581 RepID=A0AAW9RQK3_9HYPH